MDDTQKEPQGAFDLLSLMLFAGVMLLVCSLPGGLAISLQLRYQSQWEWSWSMLGGGVSAAAMAIVGGAMWVTAEFFLRRRWARHARSHEEPADRCGDSGLSAN